MRFLNIKTYGYRNLRDQTLTLNPGFNVLVGRNGHGKTNFLEAIYYLVKGASFRPGKVESLIRHGAKSGFIAGQVEAAQMESTIVAKFAGHQRQFLLNGKRTPGSRLQMHYPIVLFSPESLMAIKEGPGARRELLDDLLLSHQPHLAAALRDYQQSLRARNRILKDFQDGKIPLSTARDVLESLNESFLDLAMRITVARLEALRALHSFLQAIYRKIDRARPVDISVEYVISQQNHLQSTAQELYDTMRKRLQQLADAELRAGLTLVGPHRHEITFLFDGHDARFYCSQGQQRALILAFKMAQIVYHRKLHKVSPILLLDDVMSELDQEKQSLLIEFLKDSTAQIVLTTTDATQSRQFFDFAGQVFEIHEGSVITN